MVWCNDRKHFFGFFPSFCGGMAMEVIVITSLVIRWYLYRYHALKNVKSIDNMYRLITFWCNSDRQCSSSSMTSLISQFIVVPCINHQRDTRSHEFNINRFPFRQLRCTCCLANLTRLPSRKTHGNEKNRIFQSQVSSEFEFKTDLTWVSAKNWIEKQNQNIESAHSFKSYSTCLFSFCDRRERRAKNRKNRCLVKHRRRK